VIALDPVTGSERWKYDPRVDLSAGYSEVRSRGVSAWLDPERKAGEACRRRIFAGTIDARTGRLRWSWVPIPQSPDDPERKSWAGDSASRTGAANA
jgi:hypothetical protein